MKKITIKEIPQGPSVRSQGGQAILRISVDYRKGGRNYFSGGMTERGYYLTAAPIEVHGDHESQMLGSGVTQLLQQAGRYSDKTLEDLAAKVKAGTLAKELVEQLIAYILEREKEKQ